MAVRKTAGLAAQVSEPIEEAETIKKHKDHTFVIAVSDQGQFSYTGKSVERENGNLEDLTRKPWNYREGDTVEFRCAAGPFHVGYSPIGPNGELLPARISPFGKVGGQPKLVLAGSTRDGDEFTTTQVDVKPEGYTREDIAIAIARNNNAYVEKYRYLIDVMDADGNTHIDFGQNGMWRC